jgi:hypothetical protein
MSRAVTNDFAPIDGPYQATRVPSSRVADASASRRRLARHISSSSDGDRWRCSVSASRSSAATSCSTEPAKAAGSVMAVAAAPSK